MAVEKIIMSKDKAHCWYCQEETISIPTLEGITCANCSRVRVILPKGQL